MKIGIPERRTLLGDLGGGLTVAMVSIPEGMAYALIAGVNPIYGLYAGMLTVIVGSLFNSSKLTIITLTNAIALIVVDNLGLLGDDIAVGIATLTLFIGVLQFIFGILQLGKLINFISFEVMTGFIAAVATIIIFGQIEELVGYQGQIDVGEHISRRIIEGVTILLTPWHWDAGTAAVGILTIAMLLFIKRTKLEKFADFLVIGIITVIVAVLRFESVLIVQDISEIPNQLPTLVAPDLTLIPGLAPAAIAIAIVALVESAGISMAFPNPDKSKADMSRNFTAHGLANIAGCVIAALPGGGSMSRTAVNADAGTLTRFGGIFAGAIVIMAVGLFGPVFEYIPMAALSGLLIFIGVGILLKQIPKMKEAWHTSKAYSVSIIATYVIAIGHSLEVGVFVGILLSIVLYVYFSARDVQLVILEPMGDNHFRIRPVPKEFPSNEVTIIQQQGARYFAAVHTQEEMMPSMEHTDHAVIIFSIYGASLMSSNMVEMIKSMHQEISENGNRLIIANVEDPIMQQLEHTGLLDLLGRENVFPARDILGASLEEALEAANTSLGRNQDS